MLLLSAVHVGCLLARERSTRVRSHGGWVLLFEPTPFRASGERRPKTTPPEGMECTSDAEAEVKSSGAAGVRPPQVSCPLSPLSLPVPLSLHSCVVHSTYTTLHPFLCHFPTPARWPWPATECGVSENANMLRWTGRRPTRLMPLHVIPALSPLLIKCIQYTQMNMKHTR
jgi:hypothetical protein